MNIHLIEQRIKNWDNKIKILLKEWKPNERSEKLFTLLKSFAELPSFQNDIKKRGLDMKNELVDNLMVSLAITDKEGEEEVKNVVHGFIESLRKKLMKEDLNEDLNRGELSQKILDYLKILSKEKNFKKEIKEITIEHWPDFEQELIRKTVLDLGIDTIDGNSLTREVIMGFLRAILQGTLKEDSRSNFENEQNMRITATNDSGQEIFTTYGEFEDDVAGGKISEKEMDKMLKALKNEESYFIIIKSVEWEVTKD